MYLSRQSRPYILTTVATSSGVDSIKRQIIIKTLLYIVRLRMGNASQDLMMISNVKFENDLITGEQSA